MTNETTSADKGSYAQGLEDAAKVADSLALGPEYNGRDYRHAKRIARAIRALPIPGDQSDALREALEETGGKLNQRPDCLPPEPEKSEAEVKEIRDRLIRELTEIHDVEKMVKKLGYGSTLEALTALSRSNKTDALREALEDIAKQQLTTEPDEETECRGGDYEFAYDAIINVARKALTIGANHER